MELLKNRLILGVSILTAISTVAAFSWAAGDYLGIRPIIKREFTPAMDQMQQIQQSVMLMQFQFLIEKQRHQPLTTEEQMQLCAIARVLQIAVQGCM